MAACLFSPAIPLYGQVADTFGYTNTPDASSTSTDPVGSPACSMSVSAMGGAACSLDIEVPQGLPGMQPRLSLVYNSQSGNGLAGVGFNLSGFSSITRCMGDVSHDGVASGLSASMTSGKYSLDGQRLLVSQQAAGDSMVFCPESNPYVRVVLHGLSNTDQRDSWFSVTDQQGNISEYHAMASVFQDGGYRVWSWQVSHIENPLGNTMSFTYDVQALYAYPSAITYNLHSDLPMQVTNTVTFGYESREDTIPFRVWGQPGQINRRLKTVTSSTGNEMYRQYTLAYTSDDGQVSVHYSRLSQVTVRNDSDETMRPVMIAWDKLHGPNIVPAEPLSAHPSVPGVTLGDPCFVSGDFNGDGVSDIMWMSPAQSHTYCHFYLSDCSSGTPAFAQSAICVLPPNIRCSWTSMNGAPLTIDSDGDGYTDLLYPHVVVNEQEGYGYITMLRIYGRDVLSSLPSYDTSIHYDLRHSLSAPLFSSADFDCDGRSDVLLLESDGQGGSYDCQLYAGHHRDSTATQAHLALPLPSVPKKLFASDFNGDGLPDLLVLHGSGYTVFWNQGGQFASNFSVTAKTAYTDFSDRMHVYPGDFNGDGLTDFLACSPDTQTDHSWKFLLSCGNGHFTEQTACSIDAYEQPETGLDDDRLTCIVMDIDGDGITDAFISKAMYNVGQVTTFHRTNAYWLTSTGSHLEVKTARWTSEVYDPRPQYNIAGDFNGDGLPELCQYGSNLMAVLTPTAVTLRTYANENYSPSSGRVASLTDGYGSTTSVEYGTLTSPILYTKGSGAAFPVNDCTAPLSVVASVTTDDGAAGSHTTAYTYGGLKVHRQGRGLLGFTTRSAACSSLGTSTTNTVEWNLSLYVPTKTTQTVQAGPETQSQVTDYGIYQPAGIPHAFFQYPTLTKTTDMDGRTSKVYYGFDTASGVETHQTSQGFDNLEKTVQYTDFVMAGRRLQPTTVIHSSKYATPSQQVSDTTKLAYEWHGLPETVIEHYGTPQAVTTVSQYDGWGNRTYVMASATGVENTAESYSYDATHRFVIDYSRSDDTRMGYTVDTWGNVLTATDNTRTARPLTTSYTYDGWGRLTCETSPEGRRTVWSWGWGNTHSPLAYYCLRQGDGQAWLKTWYDVTGRETRTESIEVNDQRCTYNMTYDAWGRLTKRQRQEYSGMRDLYTYDNRGRTLSHDASGVITTCSYAPGTVTTTKGSQQRTTVFDSWGNPTSMTDAAGTVNYRYNGWGKPRLIAPMEAAAPVRMEYDAVGNRTKLIDPDAGTMTYTYDAYRRVTSQQDGRGVTTTNTYDAKGRISSVVTGGATTTYTYGSTSSTMGLLIREKRTAVADSLNPAGQSQCYYYYTYDSYGRTQRKACSGYGYKSFTYTYDNIGRLSTKSVEGLPTVTYQYDCYGNMVRLLADGNNVWEQTVNEELITGQAMGTQLESYIEHDSSMRPMEFSFGVGNEAYWRYTMTYGYSNADGNIASRTGMFPGTETFTYDNLDRLTAVCRTDDGTHGMQYSPWGNITWQTGIGAYHYLPERPHALAGVDNSDGSIPSTLQTVAYNDLGKAACIVDDSLGYRLDLFYGPDGERWCTKLYQNGQLVRTTNYKGELEEVVENGTTTRYYYLGEGVLFVKQGSATGKYYYMVTDLQGSVTHIVDYDGVEVFTAAYDAWGRQTVTRDSLGFRRGYTGHEHLPEFSLINMNGRLYDPAVCRFLSCDNYVQEPTNSQNFNRYSYCLNNPMKYVDPSGDFLHLIFGAIIGGTINWAMNGGSLSLDGLKYFAVGAVAGTLSAGIGAGISSTLPIFGETAGGFSAGFLGTSAATTATSNFISGALIGGGAGLAGGFVSGFGNALISGTNIGNALLCGMTESLKGGLSGAVIGGFWGGIDASLDGRRFWDGAKVEYRSLVEQNIPIVAQKGTNNCVPACVEAVDKSFEGNLTQQEIRTAMGGDANITPLDDFSTWNKYGNITGHNVINRGDGNVGLVTKAMKNGYRASLTLNVSGSDVGHAVVVKQILHKTVYKINGTVIERDLLRIMDPAGGGFYRTISSDKLSNINMSIIR